MQGRSAAGIAEKISGHWLGTAKGSAEEMSSSAPEGGFIASHRHEPKPCGKAHSIYIYYLHVLSRFLVEWLMYGR
jgi:hypothetical protein